MHMYYLSSRLAFLMRGALVLVSCAVEGGGTVALTDARRSHTALAPGGTHHLRAVDGGVVGVSERRFHRSTMVLSVKIMWLASVFCMSKALLARKK